MTDPLVTAIVSTYAAERFIRGCLDDLVAQTLFDRLEIIVIDSGSPENESAIVSEYVKLYPDQIRLVRTEREPLYVAWNRAIKMARGKYLTNANTDDRHQADALECLAHTLDTHPTVGLTYADQWISETENESFVECEARNAKKRRWPDFTRMDLMMRCITGSQPMWRKSLHGEQGLFNARYRIAGDYDMWLRIATHHELLRLDTVKGVLFEASGTISGRSNRWPMNMEILDIQRRYVRLPPWCELQGIRRKLAREIFARGYQHIEGENDAASAAPSIREAMKLDPSNLSYLKTYLYRCVVRRIFYFK